ncbi:MAG: FMN-binding negative transcriptional regulator [Nitrosomonadales bacterium]|nr:FMN-binding negative transcriptional regulator [Nitrosomonadales bacterium]
MYIPKHFEQPRIEAMHELMRAQPLATLVTLSSGGLEANHIPLHLTDAPAPFGTLRGHVARANPLWRDFAQEVEALAIFHGPDAYITPSWYATKQETGRVAPTWNYAVVHAYGTLRTIDDAVWVREHLETLTDHHEVNLPKPWAVSDAPREFTDELIKAVVGTEIVITRLTGKWKASQNQPAQNRAGVIEGLGGCAHRDAAEMAALVEAARKDAR